MAVQVAAFGAAFTGALALRLSERFWPDVQEGTIGVAFVLAASLGILLLAGNPHSGEHLQDLLVGQILWVGSAQLAPGAALSAVALALWFWFGERLGRRRSCWIWARLDGLCPLGFSRRRDDRVRHGGGGGGGGCACLRAHAAFERATCERRESPLMPHSNGPGHILK